MVEYEDKLYELLNILNKEGLLKDIVLIGSWCLLFYDNFFNEFKSTIKTTDIDFYVPNAKKIKEKGSIIKAFKTINYDIQSDILTNKSKFISPDGFEFEFLTKLNRNNDLTIKLGNTDIYAESLPYLDIYSSNYIEIKYNNLIIKVASPSSYVLQKLLINDRRGAKKLKDLESIKTVLFYINTSRKSTEEFNSLFKSLPYKWKKKIKKTMADNNLILHKI